MPNTTPEWRFSKLLRSGGEVFAPGAPLRFSRPLDADSLKGRHEGRARKTNGGVAKPALSAALQQRTDRAARLGKIASARRHPFDPRQRAIVKLHYFSHGGGGAAALRAHARYVARDAAMRGPELDFSEREPDHETTEPSLEPHDRPLDRREAMSIFYDASGNDLDGAACVARWAKQDRRHFRLILSAENGARLAELRSYTRAVMRRAEQALGTRLQWIAVDHWDTANPHTHVIIRGRTQDGRDLVIPRDFVSHGFRNAARDVATERLGTRGPDDERLALHREARAHRLTRLDRIIEAQLDRERRLRVSRLEAPNGSPDLTNALKARAHELRRLGLAAEVARNVFEFELGWQEGLKAMEEHLDIRRTLMRERMRDRLRTAQRDMMKPLKEPPDLHR